MFYVQYARKLSDVKATANRVRVFLGLGVLGGAALALLAGLATATRAMAPITRLTDTARAIARTRDPSLTHPAPRVQRRGLRAGAHAGEHALRAQRGAQRDGGDARAPAPVRRRRLARAAHAADVRARQPRAARDGARGRAARGRRVRAALVAPDAPARRRPPAARPRRRRPRGRARSRSTSPRSWPRPPASSSPSPATTRSASPRSRAPRSRARATSCTGSRSTCSRTRCATPTPGTAVEATVERINGEVVLSVEDDGPGIPPELRDKVFERFFRGAGDRSGSSGLGLSIVRAVAQSHDGTRRARGAARRARRPLRRALPRARLTRGAGGAQAPRPGCRFTDRTPIRRKGHPCPTSSTSQQLVVFSPRRGGVRPADRGRARDHPLHGAPLRRLRGRVDPRRDRPARQDHPDLRPGGPRSSSPARAREPGKIVIVETGTGQVGVMVDEVEEVLTVEREPARARPDRQRRHDRGDRQDRRPPRHPAQPPRACSPRRRAADELAAARHRWPVPRPARPAHAASSSPTTRG